MTGNREAIPTKVYRFPSVSFRVRNYIPERKFCRSRTRNIHKRQADSKGKDIRHYTLDQASRDRKSVIIY